MVEVIFHFLLTGPHVVFYLQVEAREATPKITEISPNELTPTLNYGAVEDKDVTPVRVLNDVDVQGASPVLGETDAAPIEDTSKGNQDDLGQFYNEIFYSI